jgi:hypothetical protein
MFDNETIKRIKDNEPGLNHLLLVPQLIAEDIDFASFDDAMRDNSQLEIVTFGHFNDVTTFEMYQSLFQGIVQSQSLTTIFFVGCRLEGKILR